MQASRFFYCLLILLIAGVQSSLGQVIPPPVETSLAQDTARLIEILPGVRKLEFRKVNDSTQLQILAGNVRLKQGNSYFYCDSCVINNNTNTFEAWGRVHINDSDTIHIYSNHLRYLMERKIAFLDGGVRLTDGKGSLTTPDLEYDMTTDIGTYKRGGRVLNKKTVLTSQEGYYYAGLRDVYFKRNVKLDDPSYSIRTDSLLYNTESQVARFISYTIIKDSNNRTIETRDGFYNLATGKAEFGGRPIIKDGKLTVTANNIATDDSTGISHARGNVIIVDSVQHTIIIAGEVFSDSKKDRLLATKKPLLIFKQDDDSIYITADTLFSAKLTDLYQQKDSVMKKDTVKGQKLVKLDNKDSTNRYFEAYRNVKIFSDSLQAVCDSAFYSFRDSTFRLYQNPVLWAKKSQITGDTIFLITKNKKADRLKVIENSLLVNELEPGIYNQVKSNRMDAWFKKGDIDSVRANAMAECIYYLQDEDSAYSGINESKSDIIDLYFIEKAIHKVIFRSAVTGTIWPMKDKSPDEMRLPGFQWLEERRPKNKYDLY